MTFRDYLTRRLNGRKWVVARKTARLVTKGYDVFLTQAQYRALDIEAHNAGCVDCFYGGRA